MSLQHLRAHLSCARLIDEFPEGLAQYPTRESVFFCHYPKRHLCVIQRRRKFEIFMEDIFRPKFDETVPDVAVFIRSLLSLGLFFFLELTPEIVSDDYATTRLREGPPVMEIEGHKIFLATFKNEPDAGRDKIFLRP